MPSHPSSLTVDEYLTSLAPEVWTLEDYETAPFWPGDVFAIVASLVNRSSILSGIGTDFWGELGVEEWEKRSQKLAVKWRRVFTGADRDKVPKEVQDWWAELSRNWDTEIEKIRLDPDLCEALVKLCAVCDEVFEGVGVIPYSLLQTDKTHKNERLFWGEAYLLLRGDLPTSAADVSDEPKRFASLCREVNPSRARVLPKAQTAQFGLSLRSLTHYIALCPEQLLKVSWKWHVSAVENVGEHHCNMVLFPWPFEVKPRQFKAVPDEGNEHKAGGWFQYEPLECSSWELARTVESTLIAAEKQVGTVHALILPETAVTEAQYAQLQMIAAERNLILISGLVKKEVQSGDSSERFANVAGVSMPSYIRPAAANQMFQIEQKKHHRWRLDRDQIVRYSLSSVLDANKIWWEHTPINARSLNVFPLRHWLCTCPLICEDLARLDPAGQFIRALAPDLVIALLFDGPQLSTRWPAHYAGVLADDPGSSVLTITSLGMARLSRPTDHDPNKNSDVIALWRDPLYGSVEVRLPKGSTAAVLTVNRSTISASTADGRERNVNSQAPTFGGLVYL